MLWLIEYGPAVVSVWTIHNIRGGRGGAAVAGVVGVLPLFGSGSFAATVAVLSKRRRQ